MNQQEIDRLTAEIKENNIATRLRDKVNERVFGAEDLTNTLLRALLSGGHVLLEGLPGLAKTLLAETFSQLIRVDFKRVQFTPDLLPADITGGEVLNMKEGEYQVRRGPLFTNILLADEINRAPAKVQAALLEAMAEKKITIGLETFQLNRPFMVMATQNPVEQEGTYPLPEAQTDRFMFKILVQYPSKADELKMLETHAGLELEQFEPISSPEDILKMRELCQQVYVDDKLRNYIIDLVHATRDLEKIDESLHNYVDFGASPRASLALLRGARANAFLEGRGFATPDDVREIFLEALRHRLILSYTALAEDVNSDLILNTLLQKVKVQ